MSKHHPDIHGHCPMGCGRTLFVGEGGYITCSYVQCPRPDAVVDLLAENQPDHVVTFGDTGFTVKHPLRERLDDALLACQLHAFCSDQQAFGPTPQPGTYRARLSDTNGRWCFTPMEST